MIKITKMKKYLFKEINKKKKFFYCFVLKKNSKHYLKYILLLSFSIFIILHNNGLLKNLKISNYLKTEFKENNPNALKEQYKDFIVNLPCYNHTHMRSKKIFWLWFQGERTAPNISKACLNSIFRNCKSHEIIVINQNNMDMYVHFPYFILNKFKSNSFSIIHFSDLLRLELLIKYGGTWIDSTVLITKYNETLFNNDFFFFQIPNNTHCAGSSWFITAEKENPILRTTRDLLYHYWSKNNDIFDYFLFHFFFKMAYDIYNKDLYNMPFILSRDANQLQNELLKPFNKRKYEEILNISSVHKLTRKREINETKGLFYHHIIKELNSTK